MFSHHAIKTIAALMLWLTSTMAYANVLAERDQQQLTNQHIADMLHAGEQIAQATFSYQEKQQLTAWAIQLFQQESNLKAVQSAFDKYQRYAKLANKTDKPAHKQLIWQHLYREMAFKWRFPSYPEQQTTLWSVIQQYNPIIKKQAQHQLILTQKEPLIQQQGEFFLTQTMLTALQISTELLARHALNPQQQQGLAAWAKADFSNTPQDSSAAYAYMLDAIVPNALDPTNEYEQAALRNEHYRQSFFAFRSDAFAQQSQDDMMDLVQHYNPPVLIDESNQIAISQGEIDDRVNVAQFFIQALGLPAIDAEQLKQQEKQTLLQQYQQRNPQQLFSSNAPYLLRARHYWENLDHNSKRQLTQQIRDNYQQNPQLWLALQPLFGQLDVILQAEHQQRQTQEHLQRTMLMQLMQHNQQTHNRLLDMMQRSNQMALDSLQDQSTKLGIYLNDQKIIGERGNYYIVEDKRGRRFEIAR